ncbi:MAG: calcium-translocating P-type ATPase, SERCA-type [Firmicutes bacterium]|nr:calcium-translocating P-type ATPase, SERCA-type [Bacillota bacterium]
MAHGQGAWCRRTVEEVVQAWQSDLEKGLPGSKAAARLKKHGPNQLPERKKASPLGMFFAQFKDLMVEVLLAATLISLILGEIEDAVTIMVIVILNAILGFVQEYKAEKSLEALKRLSAPHARVIRDGRQEEIPAEELVTGDLVALEAGDRVPADLRLVEVFAMEMEEAAFTGESHPVAKHTRPLTGGAVALGDQKNMAFMSTIVTRGHGKGIVVATGAQTQMGKIADLMQNVAEEPTPLQKRLEELGKWLVAIAGLTCGAVFAAGMVHGQSFQTMFLTGVSLAVAAIPEGLPAVVTIALALGVQRMIRRNAIIRKLPAVETLGCTTAICSDKTGTLTQNEMTITRVYAAKQLYSVSGSGYGPEGEFRQAGQAVQPRKVPVLARVLEIGALCNNARLSNLEAPQPPQKARRTGRERQKTFWQVDGDPTEGALLTLAAKGGLPREALLQTYRLIGEIPFDSDRKMMTTLHRDAHGNRFAFVKGAADIILPKCRWRAENAAAPSLLGDQETREILSVADHLAGEALRVLAIAYRMWPASASLPEDPAAVERDLIFAGLAGMMDPPRPEVAEAIRTAQRAGIRTLMVTGDHARTALAVARQLGLAQDPSRVVSGVELDRMDDRQLGKTLEKAAVFARVSPEHKIRIVRALKAQGEIVAMTGDGVNDAPAVKEADIGVSMGQKGTDVTREASAVVLADDNYATIVAAIEQGRGIYDNIRKFIRYLLACNVGEILVMLATTLMGLPLPLVAIQILWMNLVTDGLPAIALGVDPIDPGVMKRPPRRPSEGVFADHLLMKILIQGVFISLGTVAVFVLILGSGRSLETARTVAFTTLVAAQLVFVFRCRSERLSLWQINPGANPFLLIAVAISFAMQLLVIYSPQLQAVFKTVPLGSGEWSLIVFFAMGGTVLTDLAVFVRRRVLGRLALLRV